MKYPLFILRQLSPYVFLPQACHDHEVNQSTKSASADKQYIFTMVVYSGLFIGRSIEVLTIHLHIYNFFFRQSVIQLNEFKQLCNEGLKRNCTVTTLLVILMIYMFIHCESIPILGMILELQHGKDYCEDYVYEHYTVYWLLDIIRYLNAILIHSLMILAMIAIKELWLYEKSSANVARQNEPVNAAERSQQSGSENTDGNTQQNQSGNVTESEPEAYTINEYLQDRKETNEDHEMRTKEYAEIGRKVELVLEIFQTWFPIPWLLYLIAKSLDTNSVLKAWRDGSSDRNYFSEISYMVYNFNQLSLLVIAFLCLKRMNTYHSKYLSRHNQIGKFDTASKMAMASMNKIEKDERFDFVPRVWGTGIEVPVDSSLFTITMLISIFFTVCEALI